MYKWSYTCRDNGGKYQCFTVKAATKHEAIKKGAERARKHAAGDITTWDCKLIMVF